MKSKDHLFMFKTTIMVNKRENIYCIVSIPDKRLSSFFISLILTLSFYYFLFFPYLFRFDFAHSFLPTCLGGTFSPLLDISERNFFPRWEGVRAPSAHPPILRTRLCWAQHVAFVCMKLQQCWHLLVLVAYSLKPVKLLGQCKHCRRLKTPSTRNNVATCCLRLHWPLN